MNIKNETFVLIKGDFMQKIYDKNKIEEALKNCKYADILSELEIPLFLIKYEKGEGISTNNCFQIVISGNLSIFFIRDDGSAYSLSIGSEDYIIGELNLFTTVDNNVIAEATSSLLTIAIDTKTYKERLLSNTNFLKFIATTLADKMIAITNSNAAPSSLSERVINYMNFKCENHIIHGIEKTAFRLHCSPRQLQRILNKFEKDNIVIKLGKGKYKLTFN